MMQHLNGTPWLDTIGGPETQELLSETVTDEDGTWRPVRVRPTGWHLLAALALLILVVSACVEQAGTRAAQTSSAAKAVAGGCPP
jgi:hypothetical protein